MVVAVLQATDPRDHVFGFIGLADCADETDSLIDYSQSVPLVFASVVKFCLDRYRNLNIFMLIFPTAC